MKQCYGIYPKDNKGWAVTAVAPENVDITKPLYTMVDKNNTFLYNLKLKGIRSTKRGLEYSDEINKFTNPWLDILINDFAVPLLSEKLKMFFDSKIKMESYLKWIKIKIHGTNSVMIYYVPEFIKKLDVLNIEKCTINKYDNSIIVPCFSYEKVQKYVLFHTPLENEFLWKVPHGIYITEETRKKLIENKFTGIYYEKIRTSE
jgi:hypothetical protein